MCFLWVEVWLMFLYESVLRSQAGCVKTTFFPTPVWNCNESLFKGLVTNCLRGSNHTDRVPCEFIRMWSCDTRDSYAFEPNFRLLISHTNELTPNESQLWRQEEMWLPWMSDPQRSQAGKDTLLPSGYEDWLLCELIRYLHELILPDWWLHKCPHPAPTKIYNANCTKEEMGWYAG